MYRGTTPTLTFGLPFATDNIKSLYITFVDKNDSIVLEKDIASCTLSGKSVSVTLTQEETLALEGRSETRIQLRVLDNNGTALASDIITVQVKEILKDGVIE